MAWHVNLQNPPRLRVSTPRTSETPPPPSGGVLGTQPNDEHHDPDDSGYEH